jgi:hypothetical protein
MDPIHPITPGPPAIPPSGTPPVQRLERITRERDRPPSDRQQRRREPPPPSEPASSPQGEHGEDDGEHPHVDVRA